MKPKTKTIKAWAVLVWNIDVGEKDKWQLMFASFVRDTAIEDKNWWRNNTDDKAKIIPCKITYEI